ncbi:gtpase activating protein [Anopheles sinensis]|uniref:Gtpase activating protein n=1 Tax=Anopheles sinensis TaxID=74873 RepID=A0A084VW08_ANOSI|nr:gtpase activating protein [Anopheles sinensis]
MLAQSRKIDKPDDDRTGPGSRRNGFICAILYPPPLSSLNPPTPPVRLASPRLEAPANRKVAPVRTGRTERVLPEKIDRKANKPSRSARRAKKAGSGRKYKQTLSEPDTNQPIGNSRLSSGANRWACNEFGMDAGDDH